MSSDGVHMRTIFLARCVALRDYPIWGWRHPSLGPRGSGGRRVTEIGVGIAIARDPLLGPGRALVSASGSYLR
jgi:hypothetical protein